MDWLKLNSKGILRGSLSTTDNTTQLIWIKFLAMANETRDRDGYLRYAKGRPYTLTYIAQVCNVNLDELNDAIKEFQNDIRDGMPRIEFTEDGSIRLNNWMYYQGKPESEVAKQLSIAKTRETKRRQEATTQGLMMAANTINITQQELKKDIKELREDVVRAIPVEIIKEKSIEESKRG